MGLFDRFLSSSSVPAETDGTDDITTEFKPGSSEDVVPEVSELDQVKAELIRVKDEYATFANNVTRLMPAEIHEDMRVGTPIYEAVAKFIASRS